jgi:arylsulfatase A-like enzyme
LANAKLPDSFKTDGVSLVSFLKGGMVPNRDCFYWELHEGTPIQAVRFGDWKAVRNAPGSKIELYDLKSDPGEKNDLAAQKKDLVLKAEKLMRTSRVDDPKWPMVARQNQKNNNKKK